MNAWYLVAFGTNIAVLYMTVTWFLAKRTDNAGWVDVAWSFLFAPLVWMCFALGTGDPTRRLIIAGMVTIWSLRLGLHILARLLKNRDEEDPRYKSLRFKYPRRPWLMFFGFFQLQGILAAILCAPFAVVSMNKSPALSPIELAGITLWVVAILGEILSDHQLQAFRNNPENKGHVCDVGLWRFSRHPNYFFEWLIWVSYYLFACGASNGWQTIFVPLLMLFFLTKVTGIPPAEEQSLKSRGDAYRDYQKRTSAFIPWFPKST
jgi:steroid 5-alpha reductase family enzyme